MTGSRPVCYTSNSRAAGYVQQARNPPRQFTEPPLYSRLRNGQPNGMRPSGWPFFVWKCGRRIAGGVKWQGFASTGRKSAG